MTRESARNMNNKSHSANKLTQSPVKTPTKGGECSSTNTTMTDLKNLLEANLQQMNSKYELLTERIDTLTTVISSQHEDLKEALLNTDKKAQLALDIATKNEAWISSETTLNTANIDKINDLTLQLNHLNAQVDDQVNRGLRSTLIFRGIPQHKEDKETWDQTTTILANSLKSILPELSEEGIKLKIERAHRAKSSTNIIAKFTSWRDSESIKSLLISYNRKAQDKSKLFYVSQMYSKEVTTIRDQALKLRKELIQTNKNYNYIVTYPAKLMYREKGAKTPFDLVEEF